MAEDSSQIIGNPQVIQAAIEVAKAQPPVSSTPVQGIPTTLADPNLPLAAQQPLVPATVPTPAPAMDIAAVPVLPPREYLPSTLPVITQDSSATGPAPAQTLPVAANAPKLQTPILDAVALQSLEAAAQPTQQQINAQIDQFMKPANEQRAYSLALNDMERQRQQAEQLRALLNTVHNT